MRKVLIFPILLISVCLSGQDKGVSPLPAKASAKAGITTRAVVIGISDYQDPDIPDLQFADRDAEAFTAWLLSPAGGSLPAENIQLLLNENATQGRVAMALTALYKQSEEGDLAIIYFSGHGDTESQLFDQPGFLLCWDAPSTVYYAGGTMSLAMLQQIVTTLSLQNKASVLLISDACHAGRLAGSEVGGPQVTSTNLAKQFANEVKILSCQPNEFSLEGVQWGGGRGCFSYHLTDGLYGLADRNGDATITLLELENYLEDRVPAETAPHPQLPFSVGNKTTKLAHVDAPTLAQIRAHKVGVAPSLEMIEPRGMEDWVLANGDSSILELYAAFNTALERKELLSPEGHSADDYYHRLMQEPTVASLHGLMTRNFAAALLDESQQVTNKLLKTDPYVVSDVISRPFVFDHIHNYLAKAIELLGEQHFLYKHLKAKQCYFEAKTYRQDNYPDWPPDSLASKYLLKLEKGLQFDSLGAYIYLELAMHYLFAAPDHDKAIIYAGNAIGLSPNCVLAHALLGTALSWSRKNPEKGIFHLETALSLDSAFLPAKLFLGLAYIYVGNREKYQIYLEKYIFSVQEMIQSNPNGVPIFYYCQLGNALWKLGRIEQAETILLKAEKLSEGSASNAYLNLSFVYYIKGQWAEAIQAGNKFMELTPGSLYYSFLGFAYHQIGQDSKAEEGYKNWIIAAAGDTSNICYAYRMLGDLYLDQGRQKAAESQFQKILELCPKTSDAMIMNFVGRAQYVLHGKDAMERTIHEFIQSNPDNDNGWTYYQIACLYALSGDVEKTLENIEKANSKNFITDYWILADTDFFQIRHTKAFQNLLDKYFPNGIK